MTRRDASWMILQAAASASASVFFPRWLEAAQSGMDPMRADHRTPPQDPHHWADYQPAFFSPAELQIVAAYAEILIPSDGTPGAREAQVAPFIDFVVNAAAEFAPDMQHHWRDALAYLQSRHFASLKHEDQLAFVREMSRGEMNAADNTASTAAFRLIKDMTVHAFYTSRVGLVDVLDYQGLAYLTEYPGCAHPEHHSA